MEGQVVAVDDLHPDRADWSNMSPGEIEVLLGFFVNREVEIKWTSHMEVDVSGFLTEANVRLSEREDLEVEGEVVFRLTVAPDPDPWSEMATIIDVLVDAERPMGALLTRQGGANEEALFSFNSGDLVIRPKSQKGAC